MTKEEFIAKEWEKLGIPYSEKYIDKNGFILGSEDHDMPDFVSEFYIHHKYRYNRKKFQFGPHGFRPLSLIGIEHNNGWIKLIDENTWPTSKDLLYDVCEFHPEEDSPSEPLKINRRLTAIEVINLCNEGVITHWREHKEEPKPKY